MAWDKEDIDNVNADFEQGTLTDVEAVNDSLVLTQETSGGTRESLDFDGTDDYVEFPVDNAIKPGSTYTIVVWFKTSSVQDKGRLFNIGGASRAEITTADQTDTNINFFVDDGSNKPGVSLDYSSYMDDVWHMVVAWRDGSNINIEADADGNIDSSADNAGDITSTEPPSLGTNLFYGTNHFLGEESAVRIFQRDLSATERSTIYNDPYTKLGDEAAFWKLDEGSGNTINDSSGNGITGTNYGATWTGSSSGSAYYVASGERVSPQIDLTNFNKFESSLIDWTSNLPTNTSLDIYVRHSTDGGTNWSNWLAATNGSSIPGLSNGMDGSGLLVECRQNLATSDDSVTPELQELALRFDEVSYTLSANKSSVDEGSSVTFTFNSTAPQGTSYSWSITGDVDSNDITGNMSGSFTTDSNGDATHTVTLVEDSTTEGDENLTFNVENKSNTVTVNDTSKAVTYTLSANKSTINEGESVTFTFNSTAAEGTQYSWTITGVDGDDLMGSLTGTFTIDANGDATHTATLVEDKKLEGVEYLTFEVESESVTVEVKDTSVPTFFTIKDDVVSGQFVDDIYMWIHTGTDGSGNPIYSDSYPLTGLWVDKRQVNITEQASVITSDSQLLLPGYYYNKEFTYDGGSIRLNNENMFMFRFYPDYDLTTDIDFYTKEPKEWRFGQSVDGGGLQIEVSF